MCKQIQIFILFRFAFIACFLLLNLKTFSQILNINQPIKNELNILEEQYRQEHYSSVTQSARTYLLNIEQRLIPIEPTEIEKVKYYLSLSAIKTDIVGWEDTALNFIQNSNTRIYKERVSFELAHHYFQNNKLGLAIPYYETAGFKYLSNDELADKNFELAYCFFNSKQFEKAEPLFSSIKELKEGKYYKAGNYYYGLLAYNDKKFDEALQCFGNIKNDKSYRSVISFYIAETYYFMGNRKKALDVAIGALKKAEKTFFEDELHLLAAQCYFEDQKYNDALPYFEFFYQRTEKIRREDLYKMAYCYYRINDWNNAEEKFKLLSNATDSLGQTAMYLLGDCYLKTFDKAGARNAFSICADNPFNKGQQEASLMLYAMLSYELGFKDEAARALKSLLSLYPQTVYQDEAHTLLSDLLIKIHNYEEALQYLNKVKRKDNDFYLVYQKATFGYAVQEFKISNWIVADSNFSLSLKHPIDASYEGAAFFWRGELAFKMHNYADVIAFTQKFFNKKYDYIEIENISPNATQQHAYLNMGFASMELQNYSYAQSYFNKAQQATRGDTYSWQLASLHEADAVFMQKNYPRAILLYNKIMATDTSNEDYAMYQKSIILGLQHKDDDKIDLLLSLIKQKPTSHYAILARYELANCYIESEEYPNAKKYLNQLLDSVQDKSYASKAWMKLGFIYLQNNEIENAINSYKEIVVKYPASDERMPALDAIRSLYIQSGHPEMFAQNLKENNLPAADSSSLDSAYYATAEFLFATKKLEKAIEAYKQYLLLYPNGIFAIKAHYYFGECFYQLKNLAGAKEQFIAVLNFPWNEFSENSAYNAATISNELKDYSSCIQYFSLLRKHTTDNNLLCIIYLREMKSNFNLKNNEASEKYADSVLALSEANTDDKNEANLIKAHIYRINNKNKEALALYKQLKVNKNAETAASCRYYISYIYYVQDSLTLAEDAANETIRISAGNDYWIVKSYILLADILIKQKDYFNAKATLESIVKHTKITDLKQEALTKLINLKKEEQIKSKIKDE